MLSNQLVSLLAPFAMMADKNALSSAYKSLQITPDTLRGCSAYGILEARAQLGVEEAFSLDATTFVSVIRSLPKDEEVTLTLKGGVLHWACGLAEGKLAINAKEVEMPALEDKPWSTATHVWDEKAKPPFAADDFAESLELGALSCGPVSMASAGVYGLAIDNRDALTLYSSDNVTIASCVYSEPMMGWPDITVISPMAASMLAATLKHGGGEKRLEVASAAIRATAGPLSLFVRPIPQFKQDVKKVAEAYQPCETLAELPRDRISAFIKRVGALAESKQNAHVQLRAASGGLSLSFSEGTAASDEYYLVNELDVPELPGVSVDATRMARALAHSTHVGLDFIDRGVLVLQGNAPTFSYMISGRKEKA